MSSSKPRVPSGVPGADAPPEKASAAAAPAGHAAYSRFIPREELREFAAWNPDVLEVDAEPAVGPTSGVGKPNVRAHTSSPGETSARQPGVSKPSSNKDIETARIELERRITLARQAGYQDGYRDGLSALENFKESFVGQMTQQLGAQASAVCTQFYDRLDALEQQLAGRLAGVALELARQVVRSEISQAPELVVGVAEEALAALLSSARHVCVRLHPDDLSFVGPAMKETLHARNAKLLPDPLITRGGCVVESDIAVVDASVEARWRKVAALLGSRDEWAHPSAPPESPEPAQDLPPSPPSAGDAA